MQCFPNVLDLWLIESVDPKPMDTDGQPMNTDVPDLQWLNLQFFSL
jgi:hypothetical protein